MDYITESQSGQFSADASQIMFHDLNDDCLLKIFQYLNLSDLGKVSNVCQLFKELAVETFKLEWKTKTIRLCNDSKKNRMDASTVLYRFGYMLQKIQIAFGEESNCIFFNRIVERCSLHLMDVDFTCTRLSNQLEYILNKKNFRRLINKFKNLKSLGFGINSDQLTDPRCIEQQFSNLEQLRIFGYPFEVRHVQKFVNLNPQMKNLVLLNCNDVQDARSLIELMDQKLPLLEQLGLWVHGNTNEIDYQPRFLKNLKRLNIHNYGPANNTNHLSICNEGVEEMAFEVNTCDEQLIDVICKYKELKKLAIRTYMDSPFDCKLLQKLGQHLSKLTEIEVSSYYKNLNYTDIVNFVYGAQKLKEFVMIDTRRKNISEDMKQFQIKLRPVEFKVACCPSRDEIRIVKCVKSTIRN